MQNKINFLDAHFDSFAKYIADNKQKIFRAKQIWDWVYCKGVSNFQAMSNLPSAFRTLISELYSINYPISTKQQVARDGVVKWLLQLHDFQEIETVFIPEYSRGTLCISSQVGCTLTCKFCHTGTQSLVRNLTAGEIVGQLMYAKQALETIDYTLHDKMQNRITNIVMMGMGEPLFNYENVSLALHNMMHKDGLCISKNKITLSTSGVVPMMERCATELGVNLAVSLHATNDKLRDYLVPLNKKYCIEQLINACINYADATNGKRITFEYVMLKDVNDSLEDAKMLVKLLKNIPAKVNLIPFNPWPGTFFHSSSNNQIRRFSKVLEDAGYPSPVRKNRGCDIMAACGQLKSDSAKLKKACYSTEALYEKN